jgi:hypothetical protein
MDARQLALWHGRSRIAFGGAFLLVPGLAGSRWIGADARRPAVKPLARALGIRDLALGLGIVIALDRGAPVRGWLEAGALSDVVDLVATAAAGAAIPRGARRGTMVAASVGALTSAALSRALGEPPPAVEGGTPEAAITGHP